VGLLKCGAQGLGFVAVLFFEVGDLAGQRLNDCVVTVAVCGRRRLRAGLGAQPLDPGAQVGVPVEEGVGDAGFTLDGLESDRLAAFDERADRLLGSRASPACSGSGLRRRSARSRTSALASSPPYSTATGTVCSSIIWKARATSGKSSCARRCSILAPGPQASRFCRV
jgi:hypothetical protein